MRRLLVSAALVGSAFTAELPVRTVILYKHGVGYFERAGELSSGESARLDFKASDMNDVLKSLTLEDKSGSKISGLRYDSSEPIDKRLADYPFHISPYQAVSGFLDQLKGARLEVKSAAGAFTGAIFSSRSVTFGDKAQQKEQLTLLLDSGEIRSLDLDAISSFKLADAALERQLKDYLSALAIARSKDKRSVYIDSTDNRKREIVASYMIPTPIWKSSYRLILKDAAESLLEGWAIVDNTTGEDWTNVNLSLVSGRPISFISKLYEPRYRSRPEAELPEDREIGPVVHTGAMQENVMADAKTRAARRAPMAQQMQMMAPAAAPAEALEEATFGRAGLESSVAATAEGRELGDLFEYRFGSGVTVRKSESAMLPFLQQKIQARKLLIYSDRSLRNPMHAAQIINSSGKTLDGGPITVFEAGAYAGEALVETFKTGDKRLISYGVDLGTRITTAIDSNRNLIREIKATRGVLLTKTAIQETTTYTIRNVDAKAKVLIIEHPLRPQYAVLSPKPSESSSTMHRFEVKVAPSSNDKFQVQEEFLLDSQISITSITIEQLGVYLRNRTLSSDGRKQLEAVAAQKRQIGEVDQQIRALDNDINELVKDQDRIRQNLGSLNRVSGQQEQVARYAKELADQEVRLASMRDKISGLRRQKAQMESTLNSLIEKMEF